MPPPLGSPTPPTAYTAALSGETFISGEPYAGGANDVRRLPDDNGQPVITASLPGSNIWLQLWLGADNRIVREILVDPGHRIDRTFIYP